MRAVPVTLRQVMFTVCGRCPSLHAEGLKGWNLLRQDTKVCFYCGCHEEFKEQCFAMTFVLLLKFLAMNVTQISDACSLIGQK